MQTNTQVQKFALPGVVFPGLLQEWNKGSDVEEENGFSMEPLVWAPHWTLTRYTHQIYAWRLGQELLYVFSRREVRASQKEIWLLLDPDSLGFSVWNLSYTLACWGTTDQPLWNQLDLAPHEFLKLVYALCMRGRLIVYFRPLSKISSASRFEVLV